MIVQGNHPLGEIIACKLFSIETCPPKEQRKMVNRAAKAACEYHDVQLSHLQKLCEEQKSQLATQTERVKVMREALEKVSDVLDCLDTCPDCSSENRDKHEDYCRLFDAEQALNQDSLGDGK